MAWQKYNCTILCMYVCIFKFLVLWLKPLSVIRSQSVGQYTFGEASYIFFTAQMMDCKRRCEQRKRLKEGGDAGFPFAPCVCVCVLAIEHL